MEVTTWLVKLREMAVSSFFFTTQYRLCSIYWSYILHLRGAVRTV